MGAQVHGSATTYRLVASIATIATETSQVEQRKATAVTRFHFHNSFTFNAPSVLFSTLSRTVQRYASPWPFSILALFITRKIDAFFGMTTFHKVYMNTGLSCASVLFMQSNPIATGGGGTKCPRHGLFDAMWSVRKIQC